MTRFGRFLQARGIRPMALVKRARLNRSTILSRMTIYRARTIGNCSPRTKNKLLTSCRRFTGDSTIVLQDLFED